MTTVARPPVLDNPADLDDSELFDELFVKPGLDLLTNIPLLARGYQFGSPRAVLCKALIVSALSEPQTCFYTGIAKTPLNLQIGFVGKSGRGKGRAMSATIKPANGAVWRKETAASGETLISKFFDMEYDEVLKKNVAIRHADPIWADYPEIDGYAAKAGKSNGTSNGGSSASTLDSHIRSLITGEAVGDTSLSREKAGTGSRLAEFSYRFCVTLGVQPARAHPLLKDGGGGTLQRTIWADVIDPDIPRTAVEIRAVRDQLARRLGLPNTPDDAPYLQVVGPAQVIVQPHIQDRILEDFATISSGSDEIADEDTHANNLTIRLAAIFAGWAAHERQPRHTGTQFGGGMRPVSVTAVVDDAAWRWAKCFMELSRRSRATIEKTARVTMTKEMHERGAEDAARQIARDRALEAQKEADAYTTLDRIVTVLRGVPNGEMEERSMRNLYLSKKQRSTFKDAKEIGEMNGVVITKSTPGAGSVLVLSEAVFNNWKDGSK
ncbi:MAG: hypothetical protein E6R04_08970 [Spirochaetes bacterium]|nr:MAG: hypothetical protein E6R04_08970 [Spirochaetota bacterium]